jgi:hypothetical protein
LSSSKLNRAEKELVASPEGKVIELSVFKMALLFGAGAAYDSCSGHYCIDEQY